MIPSFKAFPSWLKSTFYGILKCFLKLRVNYLESLFQDTFFALAAAKRALILAENAKQTETGAVFKCLFWTLFAVPKATDPMYESGVILGLGQFLGKERITIQRALRFSLCARMAHNRGFGALNWVTFGSIRRT